MKELLKLSLSTFKKNMGPLLLVTLVYYLLMYAFQMIITFFTLFIFAFGMAGMEIYFENISMEDFMYSGMPLIFFGILFMLIILSLLITQPIVFGLHKVFLDVTNNIKAKTGNIFYGFKIFGKVIGVTFLTMLYTFLWSLLFIIPGIVAMYKYILAPFILLENPVLSPNEAISLSKEYMKGQKRYLFGYVLIAYIAYIILNLISQGLFAGLAFGIEASPVLGGILAGIMTLNFLSAGIVIVFILVPIMILFLIYFYKRAKRIYEENNAINVDNI